MKAFFIILLYFISFTSLAENNRYFNICSSVENTGDNITYYIEYGYNLTDYYVLSSEISINEYDDLGYNLINTFTLFDNNIYQINFALETGVYQLENKYIFDGLMGIEFNYNINTFTSISITPQLLYKWYKNIKFNFNYKFIFIEVTTDFDIYEFLIGITIPYEEIIDL